MATITEEMKRLFAKVRVFAMATATRDGIPNVAPMASVRVISDNEIMIMDNYMKKTRANLEENPVVALSIWDMSDDIAYQFKGKARIETSGIRFEEARQRAKARRPDANPRAAIIVTVDEIYTQGSGEAAGKRIA